MAATLPCMGVVHAQTTTPVQAQPATDSSSVVSMQAIKVEASADASAGGLVIRREIFKRVGAR